MRVLVRSFPMLTQRLALVPDTVEVWQATLDTLPVPIPELDSILTTEEHRRAARFKAPRIRDQFIRARGLLRILLGNYLGCLPVAVPIDVSPDGKPVLASGEIEFNISHTGELAVFAFGERPVGVDVETVREIGNRDALVERFFSTSEVEQYRGLPDESRTAGFFKGWTCKEAVLKGIGCGTRDLDRCVVDIDPSRPPCVIGPPRTVAGWSLASWEPEPGYLAAVAVETAGSWPLQLERISHGWSADRAATEGGPYESS